MIEEKRVLIVNGEHEGKMGTTCKKRPVGYLTVNVLVDGMEEPTTMSAYDYTTLDRITHDIAETQKLMDRYLRRLSLWKD